MKKSVLRFAGISAILLLAVPLLHAVEQKTVFNTESLDYKGGTGAERCREKCGRKSGPEVTSLVSEGWKIVGSSPGKVVAEQYWYTPCGSCQPHGCVCIGTEYRLQRDSPPPKADPPKHEACGVDAYRRADVRQPKAEAVAGELDLLRKENESLKREMGALRQEIENLKKRLGSK